MDISQEITGLFDGTSIIYKIIYDIIKMPFLLWFKVPELVKIIFVILILVLIFFIGYKLYKNKNKLSAIYS